MIKLTLISVYLEKNIDRKAIQILWKHPCCGLRDHAYLSRPSILVNNEFIRTVFLIIRCLRFNSNIHSLLGHNGAGKTTTFNLLTGFLTSDQGKIFYDTKDFSVHYEDIRQRIGLCDQKNILYENLTVVEHLEIIGQLRGLSPSNI